MNFNLKKEILEKYSRGLSYLFATGLDHVVISNGIIGKIKETYKEHTYFGEVKKDLPNPYKIGEYTLLRVFMDLYRIRTEVDLARHLRAISIISTNFIGPKEDVHLDFHIERLRKFLEHILTISKKKEAIMIALIAYEESTEKRAYFSTLLTEVHYKNLARILNSQYNLYNIPKPIKENEEISIDVKKSYKIIFSNFNDNKLIDMLKDDRRRSVLFNFLKRYNIYDPQSDKILHQYVSKTATDWAELLRKIKEWYEKEFPPVS